MLLQDGVQRFVDQAGFAGAAHAGYTHQRAQRQAQGDVFQVVPGAPCSTNCCRCRCGVFGYFDAAAAAEVIGSERAVAHIFRRCANIDDLAAEFAGAGAEVDEVIRFEHDIAVVFHHKYGVADIAQVFERIDQAVVVALVQADAGFVEDIGDAGELGADLSGQADTLAFAARKGCGPGG
jgi:hypothetical protein